MKFRVSRASWGVVSKQPPCKGAMRGPEAKAWPGEYEWFIEFNGLDDLLKFLTAVGGALALYSAEEGEGGPEIEILDEDEIEDDEADEDDD